jgi:hypothetical protein
MNQTNSISSESQARILSGNRCYYAYGKLMKPRALNRSSKLKIYKSLIRPVVTYGCESWALTDRDEQHLRIFERRILWLYIHVHNLVPRQSCKKVALVTTMT